ncbi:DctP family TRAP transporter solute-binding subunit [Desulfofundulus thermobenzoicus]|uniref:DctP family TRAP transporter solute-binding subunit n=1 Tax=Desulfofundulus thermobenzoicus TaxID=29376 RepID=A0A6N7IPX4_9FIRM|nr:DctP family TRAP transporter solute-binding subunit [Desulfofundulus thermobenzoicus]
MGLIMLSGCGGQSKGGASGSADSKTVVLKLGHIQSENDLWQQGALKFAEEVEKKTNGQVKVQVYPNSTLGGDRDMAEGLQVGAVDFALIAGVLGNFEPSFQILELPYLFDNEEQFRKAIYGPIGQELTDRLLKRANIRVLAYWDRGPRQLTSNKPINSLNDIKGLKLRVPEIPAMVETWKAMGANPTPMAWGEVYTGLQQNVIEAQENPIPFIYGGRIYEVQKYLAITNHKYEYVTIAMSNKTWEKLTPEQQKAIQEAAKVATDYENQLVKEQTDKQLKEMEAKGMKVTHPNIEEFARAARTVHKQFADKVAPDIYQKILEIK